MNHDDDLIMNDKTNQIAKRGKKTVPKNRLETSNIKRVNNKNSFHNKRH